VEEKEIQNKIRKLLTDGTMQARMQGEKKENENH
jgi:hypothetical protein